MLLVTVLLAFPSHDNRNPTWLCWPLPFFPVSVAPGHASPLPGSQLLEFSALRSSQSPEERQNRCRSKGLLFQGESTSLCFDEGWAVPASVWSPSDAARLRLCWWLLFWWQTLCLHFSGLSESLQPGQSRSEHCCFTHTLLWLIVLIFSNITRQLPELFSINKINEAKRKSRLPWEPFDMIVQLKEYLIMFALLVLK